MDTILLINDSVTLTKVLTAHFQRAGYQVIGVQSAMEAYEAFIRTECHLILTDFVLSDNDGVSVIKTFRTRKTHGDLPIVVFTAMTDPDTTRRCNDAGADLVIAKTADSGEMLSKIEELIETYKSKMPSSSIDTDMGQSIVRATTDVFRTMMDMKVSHGDIAVQKAETRKSEVIGSLGVAGFLSGSISVFLPKSLAKSAAASMLMMTPEEAAELPDDELVDAIGELTNMIGGNIKTELFQKTPLFDISVPSVYMGDDLQRRAVSDDLCFLVPFTAEDGVEFSVEFLMITKEGDGTTGVQASLVNSMGNG